MLISYSYYTALSTGADPIEECCQTIEKTVKSAKLYCRQAMKLFENAIEKYHSTPGKQRTDGAGESHVAHSVFDSKKKLCKAIYALSITLNHAMALQETFIIEKEYFARFCQSLMLPVSYRDLECLNPLVPTPGHKAGYLFHRNRNGIWSREYFYILPKGMLMQFAKGKDIQIANLKQTLLRTIKLDSRDFVFEICSIEVYLMESILQATTKVEFEEWKAALFYWHPPDDDIPQIDMLRINTPPTTSDPSQ
ncbi:hypothetical protein BG011_002205 [Mortierella polycephala]|uniref:PH domain-containing protein n=1 Tax=Mortierella polycephala TaxID=41804 RepID=A0A9P6Q786_9FUNG|nr:hypothetical protein BG011_002205 [Mortierella polycephala]